MQHIHRKLCHFTVLGSKVLILRLSAPRMLHGQGCLPACVENSQFLTPLLVQGVGLGTSAFNEFASSPPPMNGFEKYHSVPAQLNADTARQPTYAHNIPAASSSWFVMLFLTDRRHDMHPSLCSTGLCAAKMFAHQMSACWRNSGDMVGAGKAHASEQRMSRDERVQSQITIELQG